MDPQYLSIIMVVCIFAALVMGYPVAFTLGGVALLFAFGGAAFDVFSLKYLSSLPSSVYGVMTSDLLMAVPLFVFMGIVMERSKIAEELLETMAGLCGSFKAGLGISVLLVGALLAHATVHGGGASCRSPRPRRSRCIIIIVGDISRGAHRDPPAHFVTPSRTPARRRAPRGFRCSPRHRSRPHLTFCSTARSAGRAHPTAVRAFLLTALLRARPLD